MSKPQPVATLKRRPALHERAESIGDFVLGEQEFPALDLRTGLGIKRWIVRGGNLCAFEKANLRTWLGRAFHRPLQGGGANAPG